MTPADLLAAQRDALAAVLHEEGFECDGHALAADDKCQWFYHEPDADALLARGVRVVTVESLARALRAEAKSGRWNRQALNSAMRWESETLAALLIDALDE